MSTSQQPISQQPTSQSDAVNSVQSKLDQLHQSLTEQERPVLDALFAQAAAHPAPAALSGQQQSIIFVGGHTIPVWVNPGEWVSLNPQPIPPGRPITR